MQIDKSKLKLADGSAWNSESICSAGTEISVSDGSFWVDDSMEPHAVCCKATDALAVIRANGLDPEYEALKTLVVALRNDKFGLSESGMDVHEALERAEELLLIGYGQPSVAQEPSATPDLYLSLHTSDPTKNTETSEVTYAACRFPIGQRPQT